MRPSSNFLAIPALIEVAGTTGSGFNIYDDTSNYLVSARHVLFKNSLEIFETPVTVTSLDQITQTKIVQHSLDCTILFAGDNFICHANPDVDIAVCRTSSLTPRTDLGANFFDSHVCDGVKDLTGDDVLQLGLSFDQCAISATVMPGDSIFLVGYPTSLAKEEKALDRGYPLLRSGVVAGKPPSGKIIIDCPTYPGNSGGLVVSANGHHPVGVAVRNIGFTEKLLSSIDRAEVSRRRHNTGYTVVEPIDLVIETIIQLRYLAHRKAVAAGLPSPLRPSTSA